MEKHNESKTRSEISGPPVVPRRRRSNKSKVTSHFCPFIDIYFVSLSSSGDADDDVTNTTGFFDLRFQRGKTGESGGIQMNRMNPK